MWAFDPRALGIVAADRQTQRRAHYSDGTDVTMLIDEPELHPKAAPKMSAPQPLVLAPQASILCCQIRRRRPALA